MIAASAVLPKLQQSGALRVCESMVAKTCCTAIITTWSIPAGGARSSARAQLMTRVRRMLCRAGGAMRGCQRCARTWWRNGLQVNDGGTHQAHMARPAAPMHSKCRPWSAVYVLQQPIRARTYRVLVVHNMFDYLPL